MAKFGVDGLAEFSMTLEEIADTPDAVLDDMLEAGADELIKELRQTAVTELEGPYNKRAVSDSVRKGRKSKTKDGRQIKIGFAGKQHGESLARIAYVNEYGKKNQHARPFIRTAVERSAEDATGAEARVYDDYLKSKNL